MAGISEPNKVSWSEVKKGYMSQGNWPQATVAVMASMALLQRFAAEAPEGTTTARLVNR